MGRCRALNLSHGLSMRVIIHQSPLTDFFHGSQAAATDAFIVLTFSNARGFHVSDSPQLKAGILPQTM
ncbi:hypothetical protein PSSHI_08530 [Photobacterium sp. R1]